MDSLSEPSFTNSLFCIGDFWRRDGEGVESKLKFFIWREKRGEREENWGDDSFRAHRLRNIHLLVISWSKENN